MKHLTLLLLCAHVFWASSQTVINGYAKVTAIAGNVLSVSNVNQVNHSFAVGDAIIVMQMQGDVIGANTNDDAAFGDLSAIGSTGLYELANITAINGTTTVGFTSATPTTITTDGLSNTYSTSANSSLQIITFRKMSTTNYATTFNITALAWDGNVGGVVGMEVPGTLTLNHNITANGVGFRGGAVSANYYIGGTACYTTPFRANNNQHAFKGEGIYKSTNALYNNARSKILTGGGGGVQINAGGGGGGNYSAGGIGGPGWGGGSGCTIPTGGYGYGGIALSGVISSNRIFMGGGGGGGQGNDGVASAGANGGGIILIKANTVVTTGTCGRTISANGNTPSPSGNDGAGGGGAAGSIVLWVNTWTIAAGCPLTVSANGGNGGTVNNSTHAGGGAGAQGIVIYNSTQPTTNVNTTTNNGTAGCSNNSVPCNTPAGSATGSNNQGIITPTTNPLPVELLFFTAYSLDGKTIQLEWQTASEINNDYFTVERSVDGVYWQTVLTKKGAGNSSTTQTYADTDQSPLAGISYYRLKQTDFDGAYKYSQEVAIELVNTLLRIYPNPAEDLMMVEGIDLQTLTVYNVLGQNVSHQIPFNVITSEQVQLDLSELSAGFYFIRCGGAVTPFSVR